MPRSEENAKKKRKKKEALVRICKKSASVRVRKVSKSALSPSKNLLKRIPHAPSFFESKGFAFLVLALMQQPLASLSGQFCRRILLQFTLKSISLVFRSLVAWFAVSDRR